MLSSTLVTTLSQLFTAEIMFLIFVGMVVGVVVGMLPGLSATMAIALLLPFTYHMAPAQSISLLVAIFVGGVTGGCVSAILLRIPGTPNSVATVLDGHALASKGQAARALGLAIVSSVVGTMLSGVILITLAPNLTSFALKFYFPEYVAAFLFALLAVIAVSGNSLLKGIIAALIGMLVASAGMSAIDGMPRYDFGIKDLLSGFPLVPALVGLFAVSQVMRDTLAPESAQIIRQELGWRAMMPKMSDLIRHAPNSIRSVIIGTVVGILPAVGGGPAGLIAYAQARNASKDPDSFGKGAEAGVVASESANNATIGGALITAMVLGIPGDTVTAMLIGALMIQGVQPGPLMFTNNPDVVYAIYVSVMVASVMMFFFMLGTTNFMVRLLSLPKYYLLPAIFVLAAVGIYSLNSSLFDVWVMCGFGLLGFLMERFKFPLAPVILGFLLGPPFESSLRKMLGETDSLLPLVTRPISLGLLVGAALFLFFSLNTIKKQKNK